jgi:hypothetical protein
VPAIQDPQTSAPKPKVTTSSKPPSSDPEKKPGIADDAHLTVKGAAMTPAQKDVANAILAQAAQDNAGPKATKAMVVAAIGESAMSESAVDSVYHTHKGVFQSYLIPPDETETQAHYFLVGGQSFAAGGAIGAVRDHPDWTVGRIAAHVEISDGSAAYYDGFAAEADAIIAAWGGAAAAKQVQDSSGGVAQSYQFTRGGPGARSEDSWTAATRLRDEVDGWRLFVTANRIDYFSEQALQAQKPVKIFDRERDANIIISFRFALNSNKIETSEATLVVVCEPLDYHAGECVIFSGYGPADRRWIISDTRRSRFEPTTELTLIQAAPKGVEPAHGVRSGDDPAAQFAGTAGPAGVYAEAKRIQHGRYPYVWGGGHAKAGTPDLGQRSLYSGVGFDCSGAAAAALIGGGYYTAGDSVPASQDLPHAAGAVRGEGDALTLWVNAQHAFLRFKVAGKFEVFQTSHSNFHDGPGFTADRSTAGFTAYHFDDSGDPTADAGPTIPRQAHGGPAGS